MNNKEKIAQKIEEISGAENLRNYKDIKIQTIHGFCQNLLSNFTYESGIHEIHQDRGTIDGVYEFSNNEWITSHEIGGHVSYDYLICKNSNVFSWKANWSDSSLDNCSCIKGDDFSSYEITFSDDGSKFYFSDCSQSNLPNKHTMGVKE